MTLILTITRVYPTLPPLWPGPKKIMFCLIIKEQVPLNWPKWKKRTIFCINQGTPGKNSPIASIPGAVFRLPFPPQTNSWSVNTPAWTCRKFLHWNSPQQPARMQITAMAFPHGSQSQRQTSCQHQHGWGPSVVPPPSQLMPLLLAETGSFSKHGRLPEKATADTNITTIQACSHKSAALRGPSEDEEVRNCRLDFLCCSRRKLGITVCLPLQWDLDIQQRD